MLSHTLREKTAGRRGWFLHLRLRVRPRPKSVNYHDAENSKGLCRMIIPHVKDPQSVCLSWVLSTKLNPSSVDVNEKADLFDRTAARRGGSPTGSLTFNDISYQNKCELNHLGRPPPSHPWYFGRNPGGHSGLCLGNTRLPSRALFCLHHQDGCICVWRHRGERTLEACIHHRHSGSSPGVKLWGAIEYVSRSPLIRIEGTLNSARDISVTAVDELLHRVETVRAAVLLHAIPSLTQLAMRKIAIMIARGGCSGTDFARSIHPNFSDI
ncbi:transposable element Tcb1 transposase [Trichonephila clavipes]|nr:transposable element Tcb1 transposase [Trichonephila clavipes]